MQVKNHVQTSWQAIDAYASADEDLDVFGKFASQGRRYSSPVGGRCRRGFRIVGGTEFKERSLLDSFAAESSVMVA